DRDARSPPVAHLRREGIRRRRHLRNRRSAGGQRHRPGKSDPHRSGRGRQESREGRREGEEVARVHLELQIFGRKVELRTKGLALAPLSTSGSWWPVVREPFTGAWQRNLEIRAADVLTYSAVYACVSLIAGDIAKLCLRLVEQDDDGIWTETTSAAFSPFLRKPNRYQTRIKFVEQWVTSKL